MIKISNKGAEVTIIKLGSKFKVTRRLPEFSQADTEFTNSEKEALEIFNDWMDD